jgi:hypothetical protein
MKAKYIATRGHNILRTPTYKAFRGTYTRGHRGVHTRKYCGQVCQFEHASPTMVIDVAKTSTPHTDPTRCTLLGILTLPPVRSLIWTGSRISLSNERL